MKYAWIEAQGDFALTEMCAVLDVSVRGYRAWRRGGTPDRKRLTDAQMRALIRAIHVELKGAYGSPRMVRELRDRGFSAGKERVDRRARLQQQAALAQLRIDDLEHRRRKPMGFQQMPKAQDRRFVRHPLRPRIDADEGAVQRHVEQASIIAGSDSPNPCSRK